MCKYAECSTYTFYTGLIGVLEIHDCCIIVTALLEYFEWTLSKQHSRSKGKEYYFSVPNHASGWGRLLMLISYLGSII